MILIEQKANHVEQSLRATAVQMGTTASAAGVIFHREQHLVTRKRNEHLNIWQMELNICTQEILTPEEKKFLEMRIDRDTTVDHDF